MKINNRNSTKSKLKKNMSLLRTNNRNRKIKIHQKMHNKISLLLANNL